MCICFWWCSLGRATSEDGSPRPLQDGEEASMSQMVQVDARYCLVLASNRDEVFSRPTQPPVQWGERGRPDILAGIDMEAGGTWLGVTKGGRFGVLTNYRSPRDDCVTVTGGWCLLTSSWEPRLGRSREGQEIWLGAAALGACISLHAAFFRSTLFKKRLFNGSSTTNAVRISRGRLIDDFLRGQDHPEAFAESIDLGCYAGFNIMVGDVKADSHVYASNRSAPSVIPLGVDGVCCHAVTNSTLDVPWGKLVRGKKRFLHVLLSSSCGQPSRANKEEEEEEQQMVNDRLAQRLLDEVLKDEAQCETQVTGYPEEFEKELARVCCPGTLLPHKPGEIFGTTAHSVLLIEKSGRVSFYEMCRKSTQPFEWSDLRKHVFQIE